MGFPIVVVAVLVRVDGRLGLLSHPVRGPDAAALVERLRLRRAAEHGYVDAKQLHQPDLGQIRLVAQVRPHVGQAVKGTGYKRHGQHRRPGAVLDYRLGLARHDAVAEEVQGWHRLDVVGRVHRHHFGIYADAILVVRVEAVWNLNQRQGATNRGRSSFELNPGPCRR